MPTEKLHTLNKINVQADEIRQVDCEYLKK